MSFEQTPEWLVHQKNWKTWLEETLPISGTTAVASILSVPLILTLSSALVPKSVLRNPLPLSVMALLTVVVLVIFLAGDGGRKVPLSQRITTLWQALTPGSLEGAWKAGGKFFLITLLVMPVVTLLNSILGDALGFPTGGSHLQADPLSQVTQATTVTTVLWAWLATGLLVPFAEEIIFRGLALSWAKSNAGWSIAIVGISAIFAVLHGPPGIWLPAFTLGVTFSLACVQARSCLGGMFAHCLWNTTVLLLSALAKH